MSSCATALIVLATILGPITLVFLAVSFGTDYWLDFDVDRDKLQGDDFAAGKVRWTHTRYRGLFRECYPGNDTAFLDSASGVVDSFCFNVKYDLPDSRSDYSDDYLVRIHLLRLWLAFYVVALVFFVTAFVFGLILCCWRISRWAYVAGLCAYIAAFCTAAAIAFFHGAEYLERNELTDGQQFYKAWSDTIKDATHRSYGWSYALGWVGMILAAFTATFFSLAGCYITSQRYEDRERLEKESSQRSRDYPIAMEPVYAMDDPYTVAKPYGPQPMYPYPTMGHPRAYPGPYLMASDSPRYAIGYGNTQQDMWNMREVAT